MQAEPTTKAGVFVKGFLLGAGFLTVFSLGVLLWQLSHVLLLVFGAVVVAAIFRSLGDAIQWATGIGQPWSILLGILGLVLILAGLGFLVGTQISGQITQIVNQFPDLVSELGNQLGIDGLGDRMVNAITDFLQRGGIVSTVATYTTTVLTALGSLLLVIFAGLYLALSTPKYVRGFLRLIPTGGQNTTRRALAKSGAAMRWWLLGQLISMTAVGALTTIGLLIAGLPSPLAFGLIAGLLEFVPLVGPLVSAVPAVLMAWSEGGLLVVWVAAVYVIVQQIQNQVIIPLVQRRAVNLPPVLTLFALVAFGTMFGPLGLILAAPLTVICFVLVREIYVRDILGRPVETPEQG